MMELIYRFRKFIPGCLVLGILGFLGELLLITGSDFPSPGALMPGGSQ
jgi:hypothetical protein